MSIGSLHKGWDKYCPAGKFQWKIPTWQVLQKSLQRQILAFMNKIVLKKHAILKTYNCILQKMILESIPE